ncbi:amino acid transporter AVT1I-like [Diospyros lotus]|uniref:amino acid transporter AVT1I-like n=1 Tax=Diospyros lotus TaxID=55363 RepID=UPI00225A6BF8|nr:amino acid transporter AVT1I-like [Diospyros lotus]
MERKALNQVIFVGFFLLISRAWAEDFLTNVPKLEMFVDDLPDMPRSKPFNPGISGRSSTNISNFVTFIRLSSAQANCHIADGVLAYVALVGCVAWVGAADGVGFHENGVLWKWTGLPTAISMYAFCYGGHAVLPTLPNSMRERSQFPQVLCICFLVSTITYGSTVVIGYLMYGQDLMSQVTLNLPVNNRNPKIAIYTTLINPITKYALIVSPIATALEERLPLQNSRLISLLLKTGLVISTVVVALAVPFSGYVITSQSFGAELMLIGAIIVMGASVVVLGSYTLVRQIVEHLHRV